jgi:LmbE family N-acetylglucosaminyl deacetylase
MVKTEFKSNTFSRRKLIGNLLLGSAFMTVNNFYSPQSAKAATSYSVGREKWLIVSAHPDDESKASSLILTERKPDDELIILIMRLTGESGLPGHKNITREEAIQHRYGEMQKSAAFLKADNLRWWLPPKPGNEKISKTSANIKKMVELLNEIKPTRIITHWGIGDSHPDHAGTCAVMNKAVKQIDKSNRLKSIYYYGTAERHKKLLNFIPNYFTDISDPSILASVLWSRAVHKSQLNFIVMNDYVNYYKKNGQKAGCEYADAFVKRDIIR